MNCAPCLLEPRPLCDAGVQQSPHRAERPHAGRYWGDFLCSSLDVIIPSTGQSTVKFHCPIHDSQR